MNSGLSGVWRQVHQSVKLARYGIPLGGDSELADEATMTRMLEDRRKL
jgi:recombinational DNA repair protein RecR